MKRILLLVALLAAAAAQAQNVEKKTFVYAVKGADTLRLDRYTAPTPDSRMQPCMVFAFGGGFVSGERDGGGYLPYFDYYARQGWVVVSIDYRLGMKKALEAGTLSEDTFPEALVSTVSMAVEDLYDATSYVLSHADAWNVDAALVVTSGSSAGAITVLMGEYGICNDSPLARNNLPQNFNYAGVIAYAGGIFDQGDELRWAHDPCPLMLFHGDADRNVPYDILSEGGYGFFGSKHIAEYLTVRRVPHWFYSVADTDHAMASRPMEENRYEIDAFLEKLVRQRQPLVVDTYVTPLDAPRLPKTFTLADYIEANFGR